MQHCQNQYLYHNYLNSSKSKKSQSRTSKGKGEGPCILLSWVRQVLLETYKHLICPQVCWKQRRVCTDWSAIVTSCSFLGHSGLTASRVSTNGKNDNVSFHLPEAWLIWKPAGAGGNGKYESILA
jgi:hypothetical protein